MPKNLARALALVVFVALQGLLVSCVSMSAKSRLLTKDTIVLGQVALVLDAKRFTENNEAARFGNRSTEALFAALRERLPPMLAGHGVSLVDPGPPIAASAPASAPDRNVLTLKSTHATHDRNGTDGELYVRAELRVPQSTAVAWWSEIRVQMIFAGTIDSQTADKVSRELLGRMRADGIQFAR